MNSMILVAFFLGSDPAIQHDKCLDQYRAALSADQGPSRSGFAEPSTQEGDAQQELANCQHQVAEQRAGIRPTWDQIEKEKAEADRLKAVAANPVFVHAVLSAMLCHNELSRKDTRQRIAVEKRYTREGGVVDLTKMHDLQEELREADDADASIKKELLRRKIGPQSCSAPLVNKLLRCDQDRDRDECAKPGLVEPLLLMPPRPSQMAFYNLDE